MTAKLKIPAMILSDWKNIPYIIWQDLVIDAFELLCDEVRKSKSKLLLIATWYRSPNSCHDLFQKFEYFLKLVDDEDIEINITGDLELPKSQVTCKLGNTTLK